MASKITRTKRSGSKGNISDLAKAAASRGKDAGNVIANQVIDRIVNNSSEEFQRYLAQAGNGNAAVNAASLMAAPPSPVPFGTPEQAVSVPPVPFGSPAALFDGAMASDVPAGMPLEPAPFATPPVLMPSAAPSMPLPSASPLPGAPSLVPNRPSGVGPEMEMLLRSVGLI